MNSNILRAPLIKSATLLAVVSLLVYLTATSAEGSIWSSLGTLFVASFRIVQLGLGLLISLFFCLAVLTGIFLGGVAMVSRQSAAKMGDQLRQQISDRLLFLRSLVIRETPSMGERIAVASDSGLQEELPETIKSTLAAARESQAKTEVKIESLLQRLDLIEQDGEMGNRLEGQGEPIQALETQVQQLQGEMEGLQRKVDELINRLPGEQANPVLLALGSRMDALEKTVVPLKDEMASIREASVSGEVPEKHDRQGEKEPVEQRLFTYLNNKEMQTRIEALVTETLNSDMSYAQVIDHLITHARGKAAEIIGAHPSLVKDYIRYRRNNR